VGGAALVIRLPWAAEHGTSEGAWQIKRQKGANDAKRGALLTQTDARNHHRSLRALLDQQRRARGLPPIDEDRIEDFIVEELRAVPGILRVGPAAGPAVLEL
jgi:hypothetical protein